LNDEGNDEKKCGPVTAISVNNPNYGLILNTDAKSTL
jgi:hypothetical protein